MVKAYLLLISRMSIQQGDDDDDLSVYHNSQARIMCGVGPTHQLSE